MIIATGGRSEGLNLFSVVIGAMESPEARDTWQLAGDVGDKGVCSGCAGVERHATIARLYVWKRWTWKRGLSGH